LLDERGSRAGIAGGLRALMKPIRLEQSFTIPAQVERVFAALTTKAALERWFAEHALIEPRVGGAMRFWGRHTLETPRAEDADQRITKIEPPRFLGFTWKLGGAESDVKFLLTADLAGKANQSSRLTVHHTIRGTLPFERAAHRIDDWWKLAISNLIAHLAGGEGILRPDYVAMRQMIRISIDLEARRELVFKALVDPVSLNRWVASAAEVELNAGGRYSYGWNYEVEGRPVQGGPTTILDLAPNERLVHDWPDWRGDPSGHGTRVSWELAELDARRTRLVLVHEGFERPEDMGDYPLGWRSFLAALRTEVERISRPFDLEQAIALLARTPAILRAWLAGLDPAWTGCDEGADTFSPREVLGHLVHGEVTDWIPRAKMILEHGESRPFEPFDRFAQRALYASLSVDELLNRFERLRERNLQKLRDLDIGPSTLVRKGRHPALGPVTMRELLATWVVHDLTHVRQIARTMAKRYRLEVGPWTAYLPILGE
jgi:uncharacterized protein YndB with AHSA1/START domain